MLEKNIVKFEPYDSSYDDYNYQLIVLKLHLIWVVIDPLLKASIYYLLFVYGRFLELNENVCPFFPWAVWFASTSHLQGLIRVNIYLFVLYFRDYSDERIICLYWYFKALHLYNHCFNVLSILYLTHLLVLYVLSPSVDYAITMSCSNEKSLIEKKLYLKSGTNYNIPKNDLERLKHIIVSWHLLE